MAERKASTGRLADAAGDGKPNQEAQVPRLFATLEEKWKSEDGGEEQYGNPGWRLVCSLFGGILLLVAWFQFVTTIQFLRHTSGAVATVEEVQVYGYHEVPFHEVVVHFTTANGEQVRTRVRQTVAGSLVADPQKGGTVNVRYNRQSPSSAKLSSFDELWFGPGMAALVGLGFIYFGWRSS